MMFPRPPQIMTSHPRTLMAAIVGFACVAATGAFADAYNPVRLGDDDLGHVKRICADVVGVPPGGTHYAACVQSLSSSLRDLERTQGLRQARAACLRQGLAPNTSALAECELTNARDGGAPATDGGPARPGGQASYFAVSPAVSWRRGELACAELGFDPSGGAFPACAANLQAALSRQSTP
jgi:hypothetical protein